MKTNKYDFIIIGAGSAGLNLVGFLNNVKLKVLLIDKSDKNIGGDCLNSGCIPSKALIHVARTINSSNEASKYGITVGGDLDFKKVINHVNKSIDKIRIHDNAEYFRSKGIEVIFGDAKFKSANSVDVNGYEYFGKKIIIATGSRPRKLNIPGIEKIDVLTNENIFSLQDLPKNLLVVGTGPIGIELGQAFQMLGSNVTFVGAEEFILAKEKYEISQVLFNKLETSGAKFYLNSNILQIDNNILTIENKINKQVEHIPFDKILVSIGRELNIDNLQLDKANVQVNNGKIVIDKYLRTTNSNIFVSGDAAGSYQFTHAAELHSKLLINNFFNPFKKISLSYDNFSWVTYTTPEIATFGLQEQTLKEKNIDFDKLSSSFEFEDRAIVDENQDGKSEIYIDKNKKILGGTMISNNAGELVSELVLAMNSGLSINNIFNKTYAYPIASRINRKLVLEYNRNRLNKFNIKLLNFLFKILN